MDGAGAKDETPDERMVTVTVTLDEEGSQPIAQFRLRESQVHGHTPWDTLSLDEAVHLIESVKAYIATTEDADEPGTLTAGPFLRARQR